VTAVVLAGGRAARFGGDKLAADLGGRSVLDRTVDVVRSIAGEVIVVGRSGSVGSAAHGAVEAGLGGARLVADERPGEGPLAGLVTGLRAARGSIVLVVGGDMPRLDPGVLRLLVTRLHSRVARPRAPEVTLAAVLEQGGGPRPLPLVALREPALAAAEACLSNGERSLRALLAMLSAATVPEAEWRLIDPSGGTLLDVDTPDDLERLRREG
jgi:molybdopterin-guanine dinucleotide biosynthesis protein A